MALTQSQVSDLFVAVFGRASEGEGNTFWQTSTYSDSMTTAADQMFTLSVVTDYFGVTDFTTEASIRTVVEAIYLNALGKSPTDDAAGIQGWIDYVFVSGNSMGQMAAALTVAARDPANAGAAQDAFINKSTISSYAADKLSAFTDFASFQAYIASVDDTAASVTAAMALIDGDVSASGSTFTLTNSSSPDVITGTSGDDTITGAAGTLAGTDVMTDGFTADNDTATITVNSNNLAPTIANIENINLAAQFLTVGMDLTSVTAATTLTVSSGIGSSTGTLTAVSTTKVDNIVAGTNIGTVAVSAGTTGTNGTVNIDMGSATTLNLNPNAGADDFNVTSISNGAAVDLNGSIAATGTDSVTLNLTGGSISYRGDADAGAAADIETLTLNSGTSANTITASGTTTGDFLSAAAGNKAVVTGAQDVTLKGDADVFDGVTVTKSSFTGALTLQTTTVGGNGLDYNEIEADTVKITTVATGQTVTVNNNSKLVLSLDNGATTYNIDNTTGNLTVDGTLMMELATSQTGITTGGNVSTVTMDTTGTSTVALTDFTPNTDTNTVVVEGSNNFTFTDYNGNGDETVSATTLTGKLNMVDISADVTVLGGSGNDTITQNSANNLLVRGGDGNDTLTGNTLADSLVGEGGNDTIDGSSGADTIEGGEGIDLITGGAGADTITLTETTAATDTVVMTGGAATTDTVKGFAVGSSGDLIQIDLSDVEALATDLVAAGNAATSLAAADTISISTVSGATDLGSISSANIIAVTGTYATAANFDTALETGGSRALTANGAIAAGDGILALYSDGTNAYLTFVESAAGAADDATITAADLTVNSLIKFSGITDVTTFNAANFEIIA